MPRRGIGHGATLTRRLLAVVVVVMAFVAPAGADDDRWFDSLQKARQAALSEGKPILQLFTDPSGTQSERFLKSIGRDRKLQPLLDQFICVKVEKQDHPDLVSQYHMEAFPSTLFVTSWGRPMKLMVGNTSTAKLRKQIADVMEKWNKLRDPASWQPNNREKSKPPDLPKEWRRHVSPCPTGCEHCEPAIESALDWLVSKQSATGAWHKPDAERETDGGGGQILTRSIDHIDTTLTSMAGLALLAEGSTPSSGRYATQLTRARGHLLRITRDDGIVCAKRDSDWVFLVHAVFETSLAATFLAELQFIEPHDGTLAALKRIAGALEGAQDAKSGAWGYSFDSTTHPESTKRGWRLLATTHCAMTALCQIRDAGVEVDQAALDAGARYLRTCIARDGNFAYRTMLRGMDGHPGASAGALLAMSRAGAADHEELEPQYRRLRESFTDIAEFGEHWWFFLFYTGLAMNDRGEGSWEQAHAHFRDVLLANQNDGGSWSDPDNKAGSVFATAIGVFFLQFDLENLPLLGQRTHEEEITRVKAPRYLKPPHSGSRVKVFEHGGRHLVDLTVSVDGPTDDAYFDNLTRSVRRTSRLLFDLTDGQMALHHVRLVRDGAEFDTADIMITTGFYDDPHVPPGGGAHGITLVSKRTETVGGREVEGKRIGEWVKLPFYLRGTETVVPWQNDGLVRVFAHELCHYLLGVQDEYGAGSYCACIVGDGRSTEMCMDENHTDDRRERSCWSQAEWIYPDLLTPVVLDPGPWDPPLPIIELVE